jgi:hypothetical protein
MFQKNNKKAVKDTLTAFLLNIISGSIKASSDQTYVLQYPQG